MPWNNYKRKTLGKYPEKSHIGWLGLKENPVQQYIEEFSDTLHGICNLKHSNSVNDTFRSCATLGGG